MNKKGVSLLVSYSILVIIAVAISVFVYSYLTLYLPSDLPECNEDIRLIVSSVSCTPDELTIELSNRGLFSVEAAYIRFGAEDREVRDQVNRGGEGFTDSIKPGDDRDLSYSLTHLDNIVPGNYIVEVQPAIFQDRRYYPCEGAVITQPVTCAAVVVNQNCVDLDGDGYGTANTGDCLQGAQFDCKDDDDTIYPGAPEICDDEIDNDCDGDIDEDDSQCSGGGNGQSHIVLSGESYMDFTTFPDLASRNEYTLSGWFRWDDYDEGLPLPLYAEYVPGSDGDGDFLFTSISPGGFYFFSSAGHLAHNTVVGRTSFHNYVLVKSETQYTLYVNGVPVASDTKTDSIITTKGTLGLVSETSSTFEDRYWQGGVDDIRMYSGALEGSEVSALYNAGRDAEPIAPLDSNLIGWWRFNEGSGTQVMDNSGSNDGVLHGTPTWVME